MPFAPYRPRPQHALLVLWVVWVLEGSIAPAEGSPVLVLNTGGHTAKVHKVLFDPKGGRVISVSQDKTIRIWDTRTGESIDVLRPPIGPGPQGELYAAALSPNGKLLAVAGFGFQKDQVRTAPVYLIDLETRQIVGSLERHNR